LQELYSNSKDELANYTSIIEDDNSYSLDSIVLSSIEDIDNKQDWKSLYNKAILENILATSNSNLGEPTTFKGVLLRKDKDLYLKAMQIEIGDLVKSNTWSTLVRPKNPSIIKGR
jgi:hypothetical protein